MSAAPAANKDLRRGAMGETNLPGEFCLVDAGKNPTTASIFTPDGKTWTPRREGYAQATLVRVGVWVWSLGKGV